MDFRIFTINGSQVLLERFQEDEEWAIAISVFIDKTLRFDEWIHCDSVEQARQHIACFPDYEVVDFLTRAEEWASNEPQRLEENERFINRINKEFRQPKRIASA